jgi:CRISPR-associated endonuclease Csn1
MDPYALRARALEAPLSHFELGRVFYHLAQRRGFLSNRKAPLKEDEKPGEMAEEMQGLERQMKEMGARTLGEYLANVDPRLEPRRKRHTQRDWHREEFDRIWGAQSKHHPEILTDRLHAGLCSMRNSIFHQRPLKQPRHEYCELERRPGGKKKRVRAPLGLRVAQRARLLQDINHTRIVDAKGRESEMTGPQRAELLAALEREAKLTFPQARKLLKLPKGSTFNLERGEREAFIGDRTAAKLRREFKKKKRGAPPDDELGVEIFGERWDGLDDATKDRIIEDVLTIDSPAALERRGREVWGLSEDAAKAFARIELEGSRARHSAKALRKLVPHLEEGLSYAEAADLAYPERRKTGDALDRLPPFEDLRNPIVQRALTEVRRTVNALIARHGKPGKIRVELARDLTRNARQREEVWKGQRNRERERALAAQTLREAGVNQPHRRDIERVLLAVECDWRCPYTGEGFGPTDIIGKHPRFDVDHIIPFSRSLDDSFFNKTICLAEVNRDRKGNRTPHETFGGSEDWAVILGRVKKFKGDAATEKLRRFKLDSAPGQEGETASFLEDFASRQLNDTRYAARETATALKLLYGDEGNSRVEVTRGGVTAYLRSAWGLNDILGGPGEGKLRDDHRHHAVDAAVTAMTDRRWMQVLALAAKSGRNPGAFRDLALPWPGFHDEVRAAIERIVVSHRIDRNINGQLHKETHYGLVSEKPEAEKRPVARTILDRLTEADIRKKRIVDKAVREAVEIKLAELDSDLKKALKKLADPANHPFLIAKDGRRIPIHKARVWQEVTTVEIGRGPRRRNVKTGGNHHLEIFEVRGKKGRTQWEGRIVTTLEAMHRRRARQPIVRREDGDGNRLVFSLAIGEAVELTLNKTVGPPKRLRRPGERVIAVVRKLSQTQYMFKLHYDARMATEQDPQNFYASGAKSLRKMEPKKLILTILGEARPARD